MNDTDAAPVGLADHILLAAAIAARALSRLEKWEPDSPADALDVHTAATELGLFARDLLNEASGHL